MLPFLEPSDGVAGIGECIFFTVIAYGLERIGYVLARSV